METSLLVTGAMTLITHLLSKSTNKAAETFGQKFAEKTVESNLWSKIKGLLKKESAAKLEEIEQQHTVTKEDIDLLENSLCAELKESNGFELDLKSIFNFSPSEQFIAEQLLLTIQRHQQELKNLFEDKRDGPSIENEGSYNIMIRKRRTQLERDEKEFLDLVKKKLGHSPMFQLKMSLK